MAEFIGGFIDPGVVNQLKNRSTIFSKPSKSKEELYFLNSRNAWVRVISSVDILEEVVVPFRQGFDNSQAKKYILSNLSNFNNENESLNLKNGLDFTGNRSSNYAYNYTEKTGVRPQPGISSFSVITKNRFGTIREANIAFSVWSVEDLDAIERLYFRPGYSCIVEWGHTVYLDKNGTVQTGMAEFNTGIKDFFDNTKNISNIYKTLNNKTKNTDYNYQFFIGLIKNFSWTFRQDGGYDCSISVISKGEILESLSFNIDNTQGSVGGESSIYRKNVITEFIGNLRATNGGNPRRTNLFSSINNTHFVSGKGLEVVNQLPGSITKNKVKPVAISLEADNLPNVKDRRLYYFPLRFLIHLINKGFGIKTDKNETLAEIDTLSRQQYFTVPGHFSTDPLVCLFYFNMKVNGEPFNLQTQQVASLFDGAGDDSDKGRKILDILITDILVERALERAGDSIANFLTFVLGEITTAMGGINEFILAEKDDGTLEIKDVAVTPNLSAFNANSTSIIPLSGLKSILSELSIQSKISKNMSSMIAIAAQTGPGRTSEDQSLLTKWNYGLVDRFAETKIQDYRDFQDIKTFSEDKKKTLNQEVVVVDGVAYYSREARAVPNYLDRLVDILTIKYEPVTRSFENLTARAYLRLFGDLTLRDASVPREGRTASQRTVSGNYSIEDFSVIRSRGSSYFRQKVVKAFIPSEENTSTERGSIAKGVIPVELSFKVDGIGGMKIGEAFKVTPGVLPTKYDEFGYIILGIEHIIENNRWFTRVRSQLFVIPRELKTGDANFDSTVTFTDVPNSTFPEFLRSDEVEGVTRIGTVLPPVSEEISLAGPLRPDIQVKYRKLISDFAQAIATKEGFFASNNNLAFRNNNPGNLRSWGTNPVVDGFAKFNSLQEGWNALYRQIDLNIGRNLSFLEFFAGKTGSYPGYAPSADNNNPGTYASFVTNKLPGKPNTSSIISNYFEQVYSKA